MSFAKCLRLFAPSVVRPRLYGSVLAAKTISGNRFFSRTATTTQAKLVVTEGGNRLQAVWSSDSGATPSNYHAVWLRHNCQCPTCISPYNQLQIETHQLHPHVKLSNVKLTGQSRSSRIVAALNSWQTHKELIYLRDR